jgi:hypothetical protein
MNGSPNSPLPYVCIEDVFDVRRTALCSLTLVYMTTSPAPESTEETCREVRYAACYQVRGLADRKEANRIDSKSKNAVG